MTSLDPSIEQAGSTILGVLDRVYKQHCNGVHRERQRQVENDSDTVWLRQQKDALMR